MIELHTWTTPNGEKPVIMLEECEVEYDLKLVNIGAGQQKEADYLGINPNGRIPALVDRDNGGAQRVFESGAILVYLAEKTGRFLAKSGPERAEALSWTFFQAGGTGPMLGQMFHFRNAPEKIPYAIKRYEDESLRLFGVLESRLKDFEYLAGGYSIADMMNFSWARGGLQLMDARGDFPALAAWVDGIAAREAVKRGLDRLKVAKEAAAA